MHRLENKNASEYTLISNQMDRAAYLSRIGIEDRDPSTDTSTLRTLQKQHLLSVPFENLDIHWNRPIVLDLERFFEKIVVEKRGGFCYELNGLFNELLRRLGFKTRLVSARVFNGTIHGPEFDHAAIIVTLPEGEYLADVGYGAFTAEPLRFVLDEEQVDRGEKFVIRKFDDEYLEVAKFVKGNWRSEYLFKDIERELSEFSAMCDFQQYSPDSHFRTGKLWSIMTTDGRKTLTDNKFIVTSKGAVNELEIAPEVFYRLLREEFAIERTT